MTYTLASDSYQKIPNDDIALDRLQNRARDVFTITGTPQTTLALSHVPVGFLDVYKNGLYLAPSAYTLSATTLTPAVAPANADVYVVLYWYRAPLGS